MVRKNHYLDRNIERMFKTFSNYGCVAAIIIFLIDGAKVIQVEL